MRKLPAIDRLATLLAGLVLIAAGAALLDWKYRWVGSWNDSISTSAFADTESTSWWSWAYAGGGVVIGLIGLWWLLAHAPRRGERAARLREASDDTGAVSVDYQSLATAVAADFEARTPVTNVRGTTRRRRGVHVVEVRGHLDPHANGASIEAAAERITQDVSEAFPDGSTVCRVLLGHDRRPVGLNRTSTPRVH